MCVCVCELLFRLQCSLACVGLPSTGTLLRLQPALQVCCRLIVKGHTFFPATRTTGNAACAADNSPSDGNSRKRWFINRNARSTGRDNVYSRFICVTSPRFSFARCFCTCCGSGKFNKENHSLLLKAKAS